jgi:16S rRNA (guanine527-N7)-methyltransferase
MIEKLKPILQKNSIILDSSTYDKLEAFNDILLETNKKTDLTNIKPEDMHIMHYADSILPLANGDLFLEGSSCIDVGTGAGFPGMPLAIVRSDMQFCLLDSLKKRCSFLQYAVNELSIKNVQVIHMRAEDAARGALRESFDIAVSRALAPMNVLLEYMIPFVKTGGRALCWKGPQIFNEMLDSLSALEILCSTPDGLYKIPLDGLEHNVQAILKIKPSPNKYPRRAGTPSKKPLV